MDVLDAFAVSSVCTVKYKAKATTVRGAVRKGENRAEMSRTPLRRNAMFKNILMDVSRFASEARLDCKLQG